jgi:hypothetical protein
MLNSAFYRGQDRRLSGFRRGFAGSLNGIPKLLLPSPDGFLAFHNPRRERYLKHARQPSLVAVVFVAGGNQRGLGAANARKTADTHRERPHGAADNSVRSRGIPHDRQGGRRRRVADCIDPPRKESGREELLDELEGHNREPWAISESLLRAGQQFFREAHIYFAALHAFRTSMN